MKYDEFFEIIKSKYPKLYKDEKKSIEIYCINENTFQHEWWLLHYLNDKEDDFELVSIENKKIKNSAYVDNKDSKVLFNTELKLKERPKEILLNFGFNSPQMLEYLENITEFVLVVKRKPKALRLDGDAYFYLKRYCEQNNLTMSKWVSNLILEKLNAI